jgi:hypothetical protein
MCIGRRIVPRALSVSVARRLLGGKRVPSRERRIPEGLERRLAWECQQRRAADTARAGPFRETFPLSALCHSLDRNSTNLPARAGRGVASPGPA